MHSVDCILLQKKAAVAYWKVLGFAAGGFQVRNPIPLRLRRVWGLLHAKSYVVAKCLSVGVVWKFGEGVPAQVSSSSSDGGSKLRGPSQNSPRAASKRDFNINKIKKLLLQKLEIWSYRYLLSGARNQIWKY
ncbi:hypothetical protein AVEN_9937-1 [Araneus ventricosus]|uniref:Uncharacterized protein n=1 Tax=Araneus ventricosus TaxID=182803 RepID=A0A4Y2IN65_ARAVE|nr:hypothetical protein AVEN_9937-1 [Araneus ventricosus]